MAKHPASPSGSSSSARASDGERSWLRHFWTALALLVLVAIGAVFLQANQKQEKPQKLDAYVPLTIRTMVGNRQYVQGKVSLLIDSTQETGILGRQKQLETIVTAAIVRLYSATMRPSLVTVRIASVAWQPAARNAGTSAARTGP